MELAALPLLLLLLLLPGDGPGLAAAPERLSDSIVEDIMNNRRARVPPAEPGPEAGMEISAMEVVESPEFLIVEILLPDGKVVHLSEGEVAKLPNGKVFKMSKGEVVELSDEEVAKLPDGQVLKLPEGKVAQLSNRELIELLQEEDGPTVPKQKPPKTPQRPKCSEKEQQEKPPKGLTDRPNGSDKNEGKPPRLPPWSYEEEEYEEEDDEWWPVSLTQLWRSWLRNLGLD